jgi:hypothetical protein
MQYYSQRKGSEKGQDSARVEEIGFLVGHE